LYFDAACFNAHHFFHNYFWAFQMTPKPWTEEDEEAVADKVEEASSCDCPSCKAEHFQLAREILSLLNERGMLKEKKDV
jgi:hypothetical protein